MTATPPTIATNTSKRVQAHFMADQQRLQEVVDLPNDR
jgi:hypothetical protein